jgi:hypothetical protein
MRGINRKWGSAVAAAALVLSSAPTSAAPAAAAVAPAPASPWLALSMLTPSGSVGLAGAAVQATPAADNPPPPPPAYRGIPTPPIPVIVIWLATVATAVYILTKNHHGHGQFPQPNSPG